MNRTIIHPPYYAIDGYEALARISEEDCAAAIGKNLRTYRDKKKGYRDFTMTEAKVLAKLLNQPIVSLFLT